ncbi:LSU ribosomal protein L21p [hydrothermal vent metagenome]|uniref:LSU ribosomal protein L21p n=1 Tax=hydrothermal vent metagenome TaxID=652676 RepID=A0A3B0V8F2_9ZZZZ
MQAVIKTGGKQYPVSEGDLFQVEKLDGQTGSTVELKEVLSVGSGESIRVGAPFVEGVVVLCEVVEHAKDKKVIVFKKKRRKGYALKRGHRQNYTSLRVTSIKG